MGEGGGDELAPSIAPRSGSTAGDACASVRSGLVIGRGAGTRCAWRCRAGLVDGFHPLRRGRHPDARSEGDAAARGPSPDRWGAGAAGLPRTPKRFIFSALAACGWAALTVVCALQVARHTPGVLGFDPRDNLFYGTLSAYNLVTACCLAVRCPKWSRAQLGGLSRPRPRRRARRTPPRRSRPCFRRAQQRCPDRPAGLPCPPPTTSPACRRAGLGRRR